VEVFATADALVEPAWRDRGLLDTAVVVVRFDTGAVAVAEACFEAAYGYVVRGEVLGSAGMVQVGDGRRTGAVVSDAAGRSVETARGDQELFAGAYTAELAAFVDAVRSGTPPPVTGEDARAALAIALAAAASVRAGRPVRIDEVEK
jgi:myo-inositol 2-dehydrogenase/D-chiro-inositol 1-dehydrogenase